MNIKVASEGKHYHWTMVMFILFIAYYVLAGKAPPIPDHALADSEKWPLMYVPFLGYITLDRTETHLIVGWHRTWPVQDQTDLLDGRFLVSNG